VIGILPAIFQELRPKQWTKNLLLFAGVLFSNHFRERARIRDAFYGFVIFCGLSGVIYIINDIKDAESDRQHPLTCQRPIASGALPVGVAVLVATILIVVVLAWAYYLNTPFGHLALFYFLLMVMYSLVLKHLVILDLLIVAIGFVIRGIGGVLAIEHPNEHIPITPWFVTCVLFLALFIVICKRRHELVMLSASARHHRPVLEHYSPAFLDQMVNVATTATVMSYALYVTLGVQQKGNMRAMVYTLPFVIYGVFRYLYLVYKRDEGGSPELLLLQDYSLLFCVVLWLITVTLIMYG
jgi:4-hydroxybenzoate polyprenyltransferase